MSWLISKRWPPFLLIGLATLIVWGHSVTFGFVWDDMFFIRDLESVRSMKNIPEMFYKIEAQATLPYKFRVFRPIRTAHYAVLHALDGHEIPQPWIYHLANVCWHGATAMMLFAALSLLFSRLQNWGERESRFAALAVALGFAVHPVTSEVVCWAKGLDDILAAFFTLAALRELLKTTQDNATRWRGWIYFALAVYSKESAVPFAILPLLLFRSLHQLSWKHSARQTAVYLAIAFVYMAHRHWVIERSSQTEPISGTYAQTLVDMLPVVTKYARLMWGVPPFLIDYKHLKGGYAIYSPEVLGGFALLAGLIALGFYSWRTTRLKTVGFGLLWAGLFLLPVSNVLPMMQYMAERFLYLPLIGWLIAAATLVALIPRRKVLPFAACGLLLVWGATARERSWVWKDEVRLFVQSYLENPNGPRVEHNAIAAILTLPHMREFFSIEDSGKILVRPNARHFDQEVLNTLDEACRLFPSNHFVLELYGVALASSDNPDKAIPLFEESAHLRPDVADHWLNLARASLATGDLERARLAAEKASALAPDAPMVLSVLFELHWRTGDYSAAHRDARRLYEVSPSEENRRWLEEVEKNFAERVPAAEQPKATSAQ